MSLYSSDATTDKTNKKNDVNAHTTHQNVNEERQQQTQILAAFKHMHMRFMHNCAKIVQMIG